jgi:hypothetical protein
MSTATGLLQAYGKEEHQSLFSCQGVVHQKVRAFVDKCKEDASHKEKKQHMQDAQQRY